MHRTHLLFVLLERQGLLQDPTCAKVSISGRMRLLSREELREASELLFSRHPDMRGWPKGHKFRVYELGVDHIRLLDFYGGAAEISCQEYFAARLSRSSDLSQKSSEAARAGW